MKTIAAFKFKTQSRLSNRKPSIAAKEESGFSLLGIEQFARRVDFIHQHIKYPEAFINDLVKSLRAIAGNGSIQPLLDCLASWEATAELDASPQTRKRVLKAYSDIKSGKTKTTNSRKKFLELVNAG